VENFFKKIVDKIEYRLHKKSQEHLQRMMTDMEGLSKAEETLKDLQEKLHQKSEKIETLESHQVIRFCERFLK